MNETADSTAPVALFCYDRLDCLKQTVAALRANELADRSDLFIFSDGPKPGEDAAAVCGVRAYLKTVTGFRSVHIGEAETNRGLAGSIISGVTEIVNRFGKIIVVEDDIVTAPFFLRFMNEALDFYRNEEKVAGIHGWRPSNGLPAPETFFTNEVGCWGWATWKRGWDLFEPDGKKLLAQFTSREQIARFDVFDSYPFYEMLKDQADGKVDSWAIRWYASVFLKGKLGLQPGKNMVRNIGFTSGTHGSAGSTIAEDVLSEEKPVIRGIELETDWEVLKRVYVPDYRRHCSRPRGGSRSGRIAGAVRGAVRRILPGGLVRALQRMEGRR